MTAIENPVIESLIVDEPMTDQLLPEKPGPGVVYTETVVYAAPEQFVADAPYQLAIIELAGGGRLTTRIAGSRVQIGDAADFAEYRDGIPFFRKA